MTLHNHQNAPSQLTNTGDFAARDEHIRSVSYGVMRKRAGLPQDLFAGYWRDVLGPLLARLPGVGYYVQHHFSQDHWANLWPLPDGVHRMNVVLPERSQTPRRPGKDPAAPSRKPDTPGW